LLVANASSLCAAAAIARQSERYFQPFQCSVDFTLFYFIAIFMFAGFQIRLEHVLSSSGCPEKLKLLLTPTCLELDCSGNQASVFDALGYSQTKLKPPVWL